MKLVNNIKKITVFMVAIAALLILSGKPTQVYANSSTDAYSLELNGNWGEKKYLEEDENHWYRIEVPEAGKVYIKCMSYGYECYIGLYDEKIKRVDYFETARGAEQSPRVASDSWTLSQGTYYLNVYTDDEDGGAYRLCPDFYSYGITTVAGDSFDLPQTLTVDKEIKNAITVTNTIDFYKIHVPVSGRYRHIYNTAKYTLYNNDLEVVETFQAGNTEKIAKETYISAGTYYLKVESIKEISWSYSGASYFYKLETVIPEIGEILEAADGTKYMVTKTGGKNGAVEYYSPSDANKTSITIPATVKIDAFTYNVTGIAANAFKDNTKLKKVVIGKNVKTIETEAFSGCTSLKTVSCNNASALTVIMTKAFYNCNKISNITIPSGVTTIGEEAFSNCSKLKTITIKTSKLTTSKVGTKAFSGIHKKATIKVPRAKFKAYKTLLKKKGVSSSAKIKKY